MSISDFFLRVRSGDPQGIAFWLQLDGPGAESGSRIVLATND